MEPDIAICRYNMCKKTAQLNKVVQYLSSHLNERIFQLEYLRSRHTAAEDQLHAISEMSLDSLSEKLNEDRLVIEQTIQTRYNREYENLQINLHEKRSSIENSVLNLHKDIESQVQQATILVKSYRDRLNHQFSFLNGQTEAEVSNLRSKITQLKKDHQLAIKNQELASKRQLKEFNEQSRKKLKDIEDGFKKELGSLRDREIRNPTISNQSRTEFGKKRAQVISLKTQITNSSLVVTELRNRLHEFRSALRAKITQLVNFLQKEASEMARNASLKTSELDSESERLRDQINVFETQVSLKKTEFSQETAKLQSELTNLRNSVVRITKKESSNNESDIARFAKELRSLQLKHDTEKQQISQRLTELTSNHPPRENQTESIDVLRLSNQRQLTELRSRHSSEIDQEEQAFQSRVVRMRRCASALTERDRLRSVLEDETTNGSRETDSDMERIRAEYQSALRAVESANSKLFASSVEHSRVRRGDAEKKLRHELERARALRDKQHHAEIGAFIAECDARAEPDAGYRQNERELVAALERVRIPERGPVIDDAELSSLHRKFDGLPDAIAAERGNLVKEWETSIEEEDNRHRELLFEHLHDRQSMEIPPASDANSNVLNTEIARLKAELDALHFDCSVESPQQLALRKKLDEMRRNCRQQVREAETATEQIRRDILAQIKTETEAAEALLRSQIAEILRAKAAETADYEQQRSRRKQTAHGLQEGETELRTQQANALEKRRTQHNAAIDGANQRILSIRKIIGDNSQTHELALSASRLALENQRMQLEAALLAELYNSRETPSNVVDLDALLTLRLKVRNDARDQFLHQAMRPEEQTALQKLERHLAFKTKQLADVGKDLLEYRHQLISKEGEYNVRFGVDPTVAILASKIPKRRPTTVIANRLPRLLPSMSTL